MPKMQTGPERVRRRREKLRAAGLRPVQIWVPDVRAAGFSQECFRQARLVRESEERDGSDDETWLAMSDTAGWTA